MKLTDIVYLGDRDGCGGFDGASSFLSVAVWYFCAWRGSLTGVWGSFWLRGRWLLTDLMWQFSLFSPAADAGSISVFPCDSLTTLLRHRRAREESFGRTLAWLVGAGACFGLA